MSMQATLSCLSSASAVNKTAIVVDTDLATSFLSACEQGDIDACHMALIRLQQRYPHSIAEDSKPSEKRMHQPLYDLIGHGFATAATRGHVATVEFLLSSHVAIVLRDGICDDALKFPPSQMLYKHELISCVQSIRFVCFAALACIDQLALPVFQFLVETQSLWTHEASLCLALAMRRALAAANAQQTAVSPAAFHPMIVLLAQHYDFLIDEIRDFHKTYQPHSSEENINLDRVKALQASLLYEIVLSG